MQQEVVGDIVKGHLEELGEVFPYVLDAFREAASEKGDRPTAGQPMNLLLFCAWHGMHGRASHIFKHWILYGLYEYSQHGLKGQYIAY